MLRKDLRVVLALTAASFVAIVLPMPALAVTSLPAGKVLFDSNRSGNFELFSMNSDGTSQTQLTANTAYDTFWPKLSPDRTKLLFVRTPAGTHDTDYTGASIWTMNVDGTGLTQILAPNAYGWGLIGHPEWSPNGTKIVLVGGPSNNTQIYIVNADGSNPVLVTGNRGGTNIDPSWHPSGTKLLFVGCPNSFCLIWGYEVYSINTDGTGLTRLTNDSVPDYDPYYSPNSSGSSGTIAWLRSISFTQWSIFKMNVNGSGKTAVINDGNVNSKPEWASDSSMIYFHRAVGGAQSFNLWRITPSGTGLTEVIIPRPSYSNEYPELNTP